MPMSVLLSYALSVEIWRFPYTLKSKNALNYVFIVTLYFCFYIDFVNYYYVVFKLQRYA